MISICICTYNRSRHLRLTLESLAGQNFATAELKEVLIIDNNCTDDTADVVESFRERLPIRRVSEGRQGLAHARNKAVAEFRGDFLLFTDDDMRLAPDWVSAYSDATRAFPDAEYFGGRILPDWGGAKPRWIRDEPLALIDGILNWFDYGVETRPYRPNDQGPVGGSLGVRRRLFARVGCFRSDLGRVGAGLGRGEDTDFIDRAKRIGTKGIYVGEALCWHMIDRRRLSLPMLFRYGIASGKAWQSTGGGNSYGSPVKIVSFLSRGAFQLIKGRGDRFRQCIINAGIEIGLIGQQRPLDRKQKN